MLNNFKNSLVLQNQGSSYDRITPFCKYATFRWAKLIHRLPEGSPQGRKGSSKRHYRSFTLPRCSFDAHFKDKGDHKRPLTPYVCLCRMWKSSVELNGPEGFQRSLPRVWTDSLERPLPVSSVYLFLGSKVSEMGATEKCPHPREPLSGSPTARIGG